MTECLTTAMGLGEAAADGAADAPADAAAEPAAEGDGDVAPVQATTASAMDTSTPA
jgi:hypothetical protein